MSNRKQQSQLCPVRPLFHPLFRALFCFYSIVSIIYLGTGLPVAESKVHFITYLDSITTSYPCSSVRSAMAEDIDLTILGLGAHNSGNNSGDTGNKDEARRRFDYALTTPLRTKRPYVIAMYFQRSGDEMYGNDDIIVFNDGLDVIYGGNTDQLEERFRKIEKPGSIIFSSQKNCVPGGDQGCFNISSETKSPYRYIDTVGWIARYSVAKRFLPLWVSVIESLPEGQRHDLGAIQLFALGKVKSEVTDLHVAVDHGCEIFQTAVGTPLDRGDWWKDRGEGLFIRYYMHLVFRNSFI